jgi:putative membrane protein
MSSIASRTSRASVGLRIVLLAAALVFTPALTIVIGSASVPLDEVVGVLLSHIPGIDIQITWDRSVDAIVWETRLPRIIAGVAVAAILGVSGVVLQAVVRNALAEPYVLGVSAGASSGAAFAIIIVGTTVAAFVGLLAFAGALLATMLVLAIAGRTQSPLQLILGGLGVGFGFQALTNLVIFSSDSPETARSVMFWTLGSLARIRWDSIPLIVITAVVLTAVMVLCGPILDALASGDRTAQAVGVEPAIARILLLVPVSAAVALAVATAGGIGFVGLVVPHVVRSFVGPAHRLLVLGSVLAAGLFLVWADAFARISFAPAEVPIGVVTGLIGAPFLVVLVRRQGHSLQ